MSDAFIDQGPRLPRQALDGVVATATCYSLEEAHATYEEYGWSISFRQLQRGKLTTRTAGTKCASITLLDNCVSRRIEADGDAPEGHVTVLAPVGHGEFQINGQIVDGRGLCLLYSGAELHSVNNQILRVLAINVPNTLLQNTGRANFEAWDSRHRKQVQMIEPNTPYVGHLRALIHATLSSPVNQHFAAERASSIAGSLAAIIAQSPATPGRSLGLSAAESWRIIRRARTYIEAHLDESIRMSAICTHSATSLSKLERIFRRELQMSPSQYVLARRLVAVNRELAACGPNSWRISDIAPKYGFNHLGRFSGAYHRHFGELPSQTLRLS